MADMSSLKSRVRARQVQLARVASLHVLQTTGLAAPVGRNRDKTDPPLRRTLQVTNPRATGHRVTVTIYTRAPQALWTDEGTRGPYIIRPRNPGGMLRFYWPRGFEGPGNYAFRYVTHPGIAAQHWFRKPMQRRWRGALLQ